MLLNLVLNPTVARTIFRVVQAILQIINTVLHPTAVLFPPHTNVPDGATYDIIIAGGGTAGCVLANRLTEDPNLNVLLIEAGGDPPIEAIVPGLLPFPFDSYVEWKIRPKADNTSKGHFTKKFSTFQGKMLGGSSGVSILVHHKGYPHDYEKWVEATGDDTWSYENVEPYFLKSERLVDPAVLNSPSAKYHGKDGYSAYKRSTQDYILDKYLSGFEEKDGVVLDLTNEYTGYTQPLFDLNTVRQTTALTYCATAKGRPNLSVSKNTFVSKVISKDNKAVGVTAITENGETITINASKEVIISAGAFNTPKLLMMSGIGPKDHLEEMGIEVIADLPVGQNLMDRAQVLLALKTQTIPGPYVLPLLTLVEYPIPTITGHVALNKSQIYPDYRTYNLATSHVSVFIVLACSNVFGFRDDICTQYFDASKTTDMLYGFVTSLYPESRGQVTLQSTDPFDDPIVELDFYKNENDFDKTVDMVLDYMEIVNTTYFKDVGAEFVMPDLPECEGLDSRDYLRCFVRLLSLTQYQYSGTAAMGIVVDSSSLRVKGFDNLRVIDCSVIPTHITPYLHPAVIMIAEKMSDVIKKDYGIDVSTETSTTDAEAYDTMAKCFNGNQTDFNPSDSDNESDESSESSSKSGLFGSLTNTLNKMVSSTKEVTENLKDTVDSTTDKLTDSLKDGLSGIDLGDLDIDINSFLDLSKYSSNFTEMCEKCYDKVWGLFGQE